MKQCPICNTDYGNEHHTCPTDGALLVTTGSTEWAPGTLIRGKYRVLATLGKGGMGVVYKVQHITLEELRALKVMFPQLAADAKFRQRFLREARETRKLRNNPNIVAVEDQEQAEDGSLYIVMEYVEGPSLRDLLRNARGPLPIARALGIARGMAAGLQSAHALGMVHRDIKPDNVMIARDAAGRDVVKVADFGIMALKEGSTALSSGPLMTAPYAAPEQWKGIPGSELDGRTDLYAVGMTLYEMLTGRLPFQCDTPMAWMHAHVLQQPPPPSSFLPELANWPALDALVLQMLAKEREERPADAQAFLRELNLIESQAGWAQTGPPAVMADAMTTPVRTPVTPAVWQTPASGQRAATPVTPAPVTPARVTPARVTPATPAVTPARPPTAQPGYPQPTPAQPAYAPSYTPPVPPVPAEPVRQAAPASRAVAPSYPAQQSTGSSSKMYVIGGAVLALALVGGGMWLYLQKDAKKEAPPAASASFGDPGTKPRAASAAPAAEMVPVAGGTFRMGRDKAPDPEETPAHTVTVAAFSIDKVPVTQHQYTKFTGATVGIAAQLLPATDVSWQEAQDFCASKGQRLPTEAEWEFAARGTDGRIYPWGNNFAANLTNSAESGLGRPEMVAGHGDAESPFGVLDMSGNVWEWTADDYRPYPGREAVFPIPADAKAIRGGSFKSDRNHVTATTRNLDHAGTRSPVIGFRCAKSE
ncbi:MAG TPA: SUMF1/EgtB/PvdO family nonheme iron enzyme [Candidatus Acidoferrales bacterium]|nr:SUMF1/EgtB/PvdO family nonheme iron enzyme [Candidatus Acidoferrales bacterium]